MTNLPDRVEITRPDAVSVGNTELAASRPHSRKRRRLAAAFSVSMLVAVPGLQSCAPTVAGTSEPARAACRMLYGDFALGDQHMINGGCMVPRPQVSYATRIACRDALAAAFGWGVDPNLLCDLTTPT
jgi:hypothetical protein